MELLKVDLGSLGVLAKSISEPIVAAVEKEGKLANIQSLVEENLQKFIIAQGELEQKNEEELTKRTQADMLSDSKLSKNIRPAILVYLTGAFSLTYVLSYFGYLSQNVLLINLLSELVLNVYRFYFGGRSLEKISSMIVPMLNSRKGGSYGK